MVHDSLLDTCLAHLLSLLEGLINCESIAEAATNHIHCPRQATMPRAMELHFYSLEILGWLKKGSEKKVLKKSAVDGMFLGLLPTLLEFKGAKWQLYVINVSASASSSCLLTILKPYFHTFERITQLPGFHILKIRLEILPELLPPEEKYRVIKHMKELLIKNFIWSGILVAPHVKAVLMPEWQKHPWD